jgi:Putative Flp pilus-assembly TadE/G-like
VRRRGSERGQVLTLTAFFLVALLGMAGLAVDVGAWYVKRQDAQAAADFGALAAAAKLPDDQSAAISTGSAYVSKNVPGASAAVTPGYDGSDSKVEVKVTTTAPTFFAKIFGIDSVTIKTRAVAEKTEGTAPQAIYVHETRCGVMGFKFNGERMNVQGSIHSNGAFEVNGQNNFASAATSGGPNECDPIVNGQGNSFGGEPLPEPDPVAHDWPAYYTESDFVCNYTAQKFTFNTKNQIIPSGVYCATQTFEANGDFQQGNITVLAPEIKVNGNQQRFTPYSKGVLFFATGTTSIDLSLNGYAYNWTGTIFHPRGKVKINGDAASVFNGLIEALSVEINGGVFNMTGSGGAAEADFALIE